MSYHLKNSQLTLTYPIQNFSQKINSKKLLLFSLNSNKLIIRKFF